MYDGPVTPVKQPVGRTGSTKHTQEFLSQRSSAIGSIEKDSYNYIHAARNDFRQALVRTRGWRGDRAAVLDRPWQSLRTSRLYFA